MSESRSFNPAWNTLPLIDDPARAIPVVEFRHVTFAYDDHVVLDDLSFELMRGELLIVLGSSGGGKSTILRLAIGLAKPDRGQILIDGEDITDFDETQLNVVRKKIGMDFQDGALFDSLSVYDNVAYRCHENGLPEEMCEPEVRRLLRFVNLEDAIDRMPSQLSGGMKIRVGLARALAGKPHIVLLDEPTAGLDPPTARTVCELGLKLRDVRDVSAILVTHGLENVRFLCSMVTCIREDGEIEYLHENDHLCLINTKILMLHEGRVKFYGSDEELLASTDQFIRDFLLI